MAEKNGEREEEIVLISEGLSVQKMTKFAK